MTLLNLGVNELIDFFEPHIVFDDDRNIDVAWNGDRLEVFIEEVIDRLEKISDRIGTVKISDRIGTVMTPALSERDADIRAFELMKSLSKGVMDVGNQLADKRDAVAGTPDKQGLAELLEAETEFAHVTEALCNFAEASVTIGSELRKKYSVTAT